MSIAPEIQVIFSKISHEVQTLMTQVPQLYDGQIYMAAFWLFYADYENLYPPIFAQNSVAERSRSPADAWSPAEWEQSEIESVTDGLEALYDELMTALKSATQAQWADVIEAHIALYCTLCLRLTERARSNDPSLQHWSTSDDFVFAVLEHREGARTYNRLAKASLDPENLARLDGLLYADDELS